MIENVARAIIGPHDPVPAGAPYTLEKLREIRWEQAGRGGQAVAIREAKAAIAAMQQAQQEPVAWMYEHPDDMTDYGTVRLTDADKAAGWTETPLYAHPPVPQWQGIESAPRDGTWVLVPDKSLNGFGVTAAQWRKGWVCYPRTGNTEVEGWWLHGGFYGAQKLITHWMPLPTPPAAGGSDAE